MDKVGFEKEMEKNKALARANWKGSGDKSLEERWFKVREELNPTEFLGYEFDKAEGVIIKISKKGKFVNSASTGDEVEVITNQTPFYGESGGQVGDQGYIFDSNCKIKVNDTQKKWEIYLYTTEKLKKGQFQLGKMLI